MLLYINMTQQSYNSLSISCLGCITTQLWLNFQKQNRYIHPCAHRRSKTGYHEGKKIAPASHFSPNSTLADILHAPATCQKK